MSNFFHAVLFAWLWVLVPVDAKIIYVNGSLQTDPGPNGQTWATAWAAIGQGMAEAAAGDEIWVAQGIYKEFVVLKKDVALYGGFLGSETNRDARNFTFNTTTIYGDGNGVALTNNVVTIEPESSEQTRFDGFTVDKDPKVFGSAIYLTNASAVIANNRICNLTNYSYGAVECRAGSPLIISNRIANNGFAYARYGLGPLGGGISCSNSNAKIIGNRIEGNSARTGGAIYCHGGAPLIENNDIKENHARYEGGGIYCQYVSAVIRNNRIMANLLWNNNDFTGGGAGVCIQFNSSVVFANNVIIGSRTRHREPYISQGRGLYLSAGTLGIAVNNTLLHNQATYAGGIFCGGPLMTIGNNIIAFGSSGIQGPADLVVSNNCVYGNSTNNYVGLPDQTGTNGNISTDPRLSGNAQFPGWHLRSDSPCRDTGATNLVQPDWTDLDGQNRIQGGSVDIGADEYDGTEPLFIPPVFYVNEAGNDAQDGRSWSTAKRSVQAAINAAAVDGGEVWVSKGVYSGRVQLHAFVYLYGGFDGTENLRNARQWSKHLTVLDGQNRDSVVVFRQLNGWTGIHGFTIQNGQADQGGGIYVMISSPVIANNTIQNNLATNAVNDRSARGGGVSARDSSMVLSNNVIRENRAPMGGGVSLLFGLGDVITHNLIEENQAHFNSPGLSEKPGGGGISMEFSLARISNNVFRSNKATIAAVGGIPIVYGGAIRCDTPALISEPSLIANNTLINNTAYYDPSSGYGQKGGGISCLMAVNVVIANNLIAFGSSGISVETTNNCVVRNNCLYANSGAEYLGMPVQTGINGNISADPMLAGPASATLRSNSPCIDAGDASWTANGDLDFEGKPRIMGVGVDIGAIEYDGMTPVPEPPIFRVSPSGSDTNNGASWGEAKRTVQAAIDAATVSGGEIWVAAGTYSEQISVGNFVWLYGGFKGDESTRTQRDWVRNPTLLDGTGRGPIVTFLEGAYYTGISGFTVQNGAGGQVGGISSWSASPLIANNRILFNKATNAFAPITGGIYCTNGAPKIMDNLIAFNPGSFVLKRS